MFRRLALVTCLLGACKGPPEQARVPGAGGDVTVPVPTSMSGFSWVADGEVAGMARPGSRAPLEDDLTYLEHQDIELLISLTEVPIDPEALARHGIAALHIPVKDFTAPTMEQLDQYVKEVDAWTAQGRAVGTHCGAGMGRTGTFLAALFVAHGMTAEAAIIEIRRLRPGSIETAKQEQAVRDYAVLVSSRSP